MFKIFGINFINGDYNEAYSRLRSGGLMVVPAAPALVTIHENKKYYKALLDSDFAIPDSGLMVLVLRLFNRIKLRKLSGYAFLKKFLEEDELQNNNVLFSIDPSKIESNVNQKYLNSLGILIDEGDHYIAPLYNKDNIVDYDLVKLIEAKTPKYIMINLGGGVQERLGLFLYNNLSYKPGIICTGAAIAFFTGMQAKIPNIIDKLYLGWFWRCLSSPKIYVPRYFKGIKFVKMLLKEPIIIKENSK